MSQVRGSRNHFCNIDFANIEMVTVVLADYAVFVMHLLILLLLFLFLVRLGLFGMLRLLFLVSLAFLLLALLVSLSLNGLFTRRGFVMLLLFFSLQGISVGIIHSVSCLGRIGNHLRLHQLSVLKLIDFVR